MTRAFVSVRGNGKKNCNFPNSMVDIARKFMKFDYLKHLQKEANKMNKIISLESISLTSSQDINEKDIQDYIANHPSVLGLGALECIDKERRQPSGGRIDLLFKNEDDKRYTVELQLGKTDPSHIIRTIEYWDIENKRYQQYDHVAVIIAEDITTRFLNVIQLFNGHIPLIAIQMHAFRVGDDIALTFLKIFDEIVQEDDEEQALSASRADWESKGSQETVSFTDDVLKIINEFDPTIVIKYNKAFIGLEKSGIKYNFVRMKAKKKYLQLVFPLEKSEEIDKMIEDIEIDPLAYDVKHNRYRIRITKEVLKDKREILKDILQKSYTYCNNQ